MAQTYSAKDSPPLEDGETLEGQDVDVNDGKTKLSTLDAKYRTECECPNHENAEAVVEGNKEASRLKQLANRQYLNSIIIGEALSTPRFKIPFNFKKK